MKHLRTALALLLCLCLLSGLMPAAFAEEDEPLFLWEEEASEPAAEEPAPTDAETPAEEEEPLFVFEKDPDAAEAGASDEEKQDGQTDEKEEEESEKEAEKLDENAGPIAISARNFPDERFRTYIAGHFDTDGDGYLDPNERDAVTEIHCTFAENFVGIGYFPELEVLDCGSGRFSSLDLSSLPKLRELHCVTCTSLTELDLSGNLELESLDCSGCGITSLYLVQHQKLRYLSCDNNPLEWLNITGLCRNLEYLSCNSCGLSALNLGYNTKITQLYCMMNNISSLNLLNLSDLRTLSVQYNCLSALDLSNQENLEYFYCYGNDFTALDLSGCPKLRCFGCGNTTLNFLTFSGNTLLEELSCHCPAGNNLPLGSLVNLKKLDLTRCGLTSLDISKNTALTELYVTGNRLSALNVSKAPALKNAVLNGRRTIVEPELEDEGDPYYIFEDGSGCLSVDMGVTLTPADPNIGKPVITTQPHYSYVNQGETAKIEISAKDASGYQWQYSKNDGKSWYDSPAEGNKTAVLKVPATLSRYRYQYRCLVSNSTGTTISDPVTFYFTRKPIVTKNPENITAAQGETATFYIWVENADGIPHYQWQYSKDDGKTWYNSPLASRDSLSVSCLDVPATTGRNGYQYRCIVSNDAGKDTSTGGTLTVVAKPVITAQPKDTSAAASTTATFTVKATGANAWQWQYSKDGGKTWYNSPAEGNKTATLKVSVNAGKNGYQYLCIVSNVSGGVTSSTNSKAAVLTVKSAKPQILTHPANVSIAGGKKASFSVTASGTGLSYQWQYSKNAGASWADSPAEGNKTATLKVDATASRNGYQYRCIVTNSAGSTDSSPATLTVTGVKPNILVQPKNVSAAVNTKAIFTVAAGGAGLSYQWQYSKNSGKTWYDSPAEGNKTASLKVPVSAYKNGYQYRCIVTNSIGSTDSSPATLTVK